jgi:Asp-tRNA(Asn)/Glu-tRNA(Gln) amidotransferase A subunit family amidase
MKKIILSLIAFSSFTLFAQTKNDTINLLRQTAGLYDLNFTTAEADSMMSDVNGMTATIKAMHKTLPKNSLAFPFAFEPAPWWMKVPINQMKIDWQIPTNVVMPANINELAFYSIPQLASLIKSKQISSVALTRFFLGRLKKWDDSLKAVITLTEDLALKQAQQADDEIKRGIYRGPLHGIPYGLKDLFAVKGYKTTWGTTPYKDQVLDENSYVYEQLAKAGAVLCAKLSLGALAFNDLWFGGRTNNPWNLRQGSSGSSAGSASTTVAGLLPFAIGTETLGSIVSPSTRCGATGLRPTFGTISRSGAMVLCWSLDKAGPICRSAEDCAIVYAALKGTDGKDASAVDHAFNYNEKRDLKKMRIAYAENYFRRLPKDAQEWKVLDEYRKLGATIVPATFPDSAVYNFDMVGIILNAESGAAFDELTRTNRDDLIERQDKGFWPNTWRASRYIPAVEYINANRYRTQLCDTIQKFMKNYDVVIVPTFVGRQLSITNLTGNPVIVFPTAINPAGGAPLNITLIGNLYDEVSILEAAKAYQDKTQWNKLHPALFMN